MKLCELFSESKIKRAVDNDEYYPQPKAKFCIYVNGKEWKKYIDRKAAMAAATTLYERNPRLKVSVEGC